MLTILRQAGLATEGLFLSADAGCDSQALRQLCWQENIQANIATNPRNGTESPAMICYFDKLLYRCRGIIAGADAWLNSCQSLLVRFEILASYWLALHWLAFSIQFIRRIQRQP